MSSTSTINFSLRQNKAIERNIAFDALQQGGRFLGEDPVYVGLGSVWFQDFHLAHRILGISTMVSIEQHKQVFDRAEFNKPFKNISVRLGNSNEVINDLLDDDELNMRPWVVWLDYDSIIDRDRLAELHRLVALLPDGSALLATFNANARTYAKETQQRLTVLNNIFGPNVVKRVLPDPNATTPLRDTGFMETLAECVNISLSSRSSSSISGGYLPAIRLLYKDSVNMVTVGGFLPSSSQVVACKAMVNHSDWCGFETILIKSQPLTLKEMQALCQLVPTEDRLTSQQVESLGFKLEDDQLRLFERHYLRYPMYAEIQ